MVHDKLNLFAGDVGHRLWMLNPFLQNRRMVQLMRHHLKIPDSFMWSVRPTKWFIPSTIQPLHHSV